eukprot:m.890485 g.890485  ORF g.890485 m.890485 type:complete len:667 (-) comp23650_c0_seq3:1400-3400(-)
MMKLELTFFVAVVHALQLCVPSVDGSLSTCIHDGNIWNNTNEAIRVIQSANAQTIEDAYHITIGLSMKINGTAIIDSLASEEYNKIIQKCCTIASEILLLRRDVSNKELFYAIKTFERVSVCWQQIGLDAESLLFRLKEQSVDNLEDLYFRTSTIEAFISMQHGSDENTSGFAGLLASWETSTKPPPQDADAVTLAYFLCSHTTFHRMLHPDRWMKPEVGARLLQLLTHAGQKLNAVSVWKSQHNQQTSILRAIHLLLADLLISSNVGTTRGINSSETPGEILTQEHMLALMDAISNVAIENLHDAAEMLASLSYLSLHGMHHGNAVLVTASPTMIHLPENASEKIIDVHIGTLAGMPPDGFVEVEAFVPVTAASRLRGSQQTQSNATSLQVSQAAPGGMKGPMQYAIALDDFSTGEFDVVVMARSQMAAECSSVTRVVLTTQVAVEDVTVHISTKSAGTRKGESMYSTISTQRLDTPAADTMLTTEPLDQRHRLSLSFSVTLKNNNSAGIVPELHQVFLRLVNKASGKEVFLVARPTPPGERPTADTKAVQAYTVDITFADDATQALFAGDPGLYSCEVLVGDSMIPGVRHAAGVMHVGVNTFPRRVPTTDWIYAPQHEASIAGSQHGRGTGSAATAVTLIIRLAPVLITVLGVWGTSWLVPPPS